MSQRYKIVLSAVLIGLLALALRLPAVGKIMTADEENWMLRSALFYHELFRDHDLSGTFVSSHPGATVMWLAGAGIVWQEHRLGFDIDTSNLRHFHKYAVAPVVIAASALIALCVLAAAGVLGWLPAVAGGLMLASDPYLIGLNQIVHLDGLQALLSLLSLLVLLNYLKRLKVRWLVLAGIVWGLALGTKFLLAILLLPTFALAIIVASFLSKPGPVWRPAIAQFGALVAIGVVTLALIWPALISRWDFQMGYISRDTKTIITDEHVALEVGDNPISPWSFYVRSLAGRMTPPAQILSLAGLGLVIALWFKRRPQWPVLWLACYAASYLIAITLAAKKGDRYAIPAIVALLLLSGWVVAVAWQVIVRHFRPSRGWQAGIVGVVVAALVIIPAAWSPYAIAYNNPIFPNVRSLNQQGWGEGLEQAAAWLNQNPLKEKLTVSSWYPSVLAAYFNGKTFSLSSRDDYRVGYVVTYRNMGDRASDSTASDVLDEYKNKQPVFTAKIQGVPYAWVYETDHVGNFIKNVGELVAGKKVGQIVAPAHDDWGELRIGFATYSGRKNTAPVLVHIKNTSAEAGDLRLITIEPNTFSDNKWNSIRFEPIADAAGKTFYVVIESPSGRPGNAVTVRYADEDLLPGQMFTVSSDNQASLKPGDLAVKAE